MPEIRHLDTAGLKSYSIHDRLSLVRQENFAQPWQTGGRLSDFLSGLPGILAGSDIRNVIDAIAAAVNRHKPVCFAMGGHVIKTGMSRILIDLMERQILTLIAMNGAGIIHDLEVAMTGGTSEDVAATLGDGRFGMARETAEFLNDAIAHAEDCGIGLGQAVGEKILSARLPFGELSLTAVGARSGVPVTVHVALGTDILHMHPDFDGAACGRASHHDFKTFAACVSELQNGVYINAGSAVILPEVFLKALTLARNLGFVLDAFTTVNLDFIRHYRPMTNVVHRPTSGKGKGYALIGHHELLIPLLAAGVLEALGN